MIAFAAVLLFVLDVYAQGIRFPKGPSIDVGLGLSSLKFDDEDVRRASVLPEVSAGLYYPILLDTTMIIRPGAGIQFDGVGFHSLNEYQDRFLIGSIRAGVLLLGTSDGAEAGIGFELRKPVYRRSEVFSRDSPQGRDWTETSHPGQLDHWNAFWVLHLGIRVGGQMIENRSADVAMAEIGEDGILNVTGMRPGTATFVLHARADVNCEDVLDATHFTVTVIGAQKGESL